MIMMFMCYNFSCILAQINPVIDFLISLIDTFMINTIRFIHLAAACD